MKKLKKEWVFEAQLVRVIDGDTYVFSMDVGFDIYPHITVRIMGINSPEIKGATKVQGMISRDYAEDFLMSAEYIEIRTERDMSFTRYLGDIYVDGENLATHMASNGYAVYV